ncbi:MAG: OmpA family protein [Bacteroidetes bacterium]|nr:OmpA family protein [Bacteroidota bacterium]
MKYKFFNACLLVCIISIIITSCKSTPRKRDFEFMKEQQELQNEFIEVDSTIPKPIYITGTLPIDKADPEKFIFDIFRINIDHYPNELLFHARVYDSSGNFITNMADPYKKDSSINYFTGLKEQLGKHYNIREEEIPKFTVREFGAGDSIPFHIALTVDYSGSMEPVMGAIFEGTEIFVDMKFPYDNIALATFNKSLDVKVPLMRDKKEILNLYKSNRTQGKGIFSGVYDALLNSIKLFEPAPIEDPRILVVFSDGDDNYSKTKTGAIIQKAKRENINIFCVAFGYPKDEGLKEITKYTGGKYYNVYTKEDMIKVFRDIYLSLRYYYLFTYKPPKYWGYHRIFADLSLVAIDKTLVAEGEYDTSDLWNDVGDEFVRPILFDYDKYEVKPESYYIIDEIVDALLSRPKLKLEIQGHTDSNGGVEYNQVLSERRAKAVYDEIIKRGNIKENRLRYVGFGYSRPIATNDTDEGRAKNRRTQFVVLAK